MNITKNAIVLSNTIISINEFNFNSDIEKENQKLKEENELLKQIIKTMNNNRTTRIYFNQDKN